MYSPFERPLEWIAGIISAAQVGIVLAIFIVIPVILLCYRAYQFLN